MAQQQQLMSGGPGPQPIEEDMIGAIKIKDAFFIGDEYAAQVLTNLLSIEKIKSFFSLHL